MRRAFVLVPGVVSLVASVSSVARQSRRPVRRRRPRPGDGRRLHAVADDATATWWNPAGLAGGAFFSAIVEYAAPAATGRARGSGGVSLGFPALGLSYYRLPHAARFGRPSLQSQQPGTEKMRAASVCSAPRSANPSEASGRRIRPSSSCTQGRPRAGWTRVRWWPSAGAARADGAQRDGTRVRYRVRTFEARGAMPAPGRP